MKAVAKFGLVVYIWCYFSGGAMHVGAPPVISYAVGVLGAVLTWSVLPWGAGALVWTLWLGAVAVITVPLFQLGEAAGIRGGLSLLLSVVWALTAVWYCQGPVVEAIARLKGARRG
jgi:hypothetical protein